MSVTKELNNNLVAGAAIRDGEGRKIAPILSKVGNPSDLQTKDKSSLVAAINESLQNVPENVITYTEEGSASVPNLEFATKSDLNTKVDKVSGKGLSTNDYTTTDKNKVASIDDKADKDEILFKKGEGARAIVVKVDIAEDENSATGLLSVAFGARNVSSGEASLAEGYGTTASGNESHAEGNATKATYIAAHAEGVQTEATAQAAHAEGGMSKATSMAAHAEGFTTEANGQYSHAEGSRTKAGGSFSHTEGNYTLTKCRAEHAEGKYNASHISEGGDGTGAWGNAGNTLHSVGIGSSESDRKNAHEIMQNGDHYIYGLGGYDGTNPNTEGVKTLQGVIADLSGKLDTLYDDYSTALNLI